MPCSIAELSPCADHLCRFDYLLISHFLLNLQTISSVTLHGSDLSQRTLGGSDQGKISSIRFADSIIGNLGAPLRDGSFEDDDDDSDDIDIEEPVPSDSSRIDEQHAGVSSLVVDAKGESIAELSSILVNPRSTPIATGSNSMQSVETVV